MANIVKKLRSVELTAKSMLPGSASTYDLVKSAADEIERLRGLIEAKGINPDIEYIAKGGLRVDAPISKQKYDF